MPLRPPDDWPLRRASWPASAAGPLCGPRSRWQPAARSSRLSSSTQLRRTVSVHAAVRRTGELMARVNLCVGLLGQRESTQHAGAWTKSGRHDVRVDVVQNRRRLDVAGQVLLDSAADQRKEMALIHHAAAQHNPLRRQGADEVHQRPTLGSPPPMPRRDGPAAASPRAGPSGPPTRGPTPSLPGSRRETGSNRDRDRPGDHGAGECGPSRDESSRASVGPRSGRRRRCRCQWSSR